MAFEDDPAFAKPVRRAAVKHELGQILDDLSLSELDERIVLLRAEITRIEEAHRMKKASLEAASAVFRF